MTTENETGVTEPKAYDFKVLTAKLKEAGLIEAEDMAEKAVEIVFNWVQESATQSEGTLDDMLASFIPIIKGYIKPHIDKIDGQAG